MPTRERYARYRADQTTIWVTKRAQAFLARERRSPSEGTAAVLDRLLRELRACRRARPAPRPA
jgi:hypothetical protein